jgi:hypothetical protein
MIKKQTAQPNAIGRDLMKVGWVQTDKKAHEVWARFTLQKPTASALLHYMCAYMVDQNALVIPQAVLAKRLGVSLRTVTTAISDLAANQWIQVVRIGKGKECAYVVNDRVAWDKPRAGLSLSLFSASVVADADDQFELDGPALKRIPILFPGERQLPMGQGEEPPSQPSIEGLEPDLPALSAADPWAKERLRHAQLESEGFERVVNAETGEISWTQPKSR